MINEKKTKIRTNCIQKSTTTRYQKPCVLAKLGRLRFFRFFNFNFDNKAQHYFRHHDYSTTKNTYTLHCRLAGRCSHVIGLIKSLQGLKLHNFSHVPDQLSCTSLPQQWHIPRGDRIEPVPINQRKPGNENRHCAKQILIKSNCNQSISFFFLYKPGLLLLVSILQSSLS